MQWASGGVNGDLNAKIFKTEFVGIGVGVKVGVLDGSVNVQVDFQRKKNASKWNEEIVVVDE